MNLIASGAIFAHGVGNRSDLPLPFGLAVGGAATAVALSFVLLAALWPQPRLNGPTAGRPLPGWLVAFLDSRTSRTLLAVLGFVSTGYVLLALVAGKDDAANPVPYVVYVLLWVALAIVSMLLGSVWQRLNPLRHLHRAVLRLAKVDPAEGALELPSGWGCWPAAFGLLAFTWLELVAPDNATLPVLRLAVLGYATVQLLAGFTFGSGWFARGDAFELWSALLGRLSILGRRVDGVRVVRSPLAGLDSLPATPGLTAAVTVILGTTAYDGASNLPAWFIFVQSSPWPSELLQTAGLLTVVGVVWLLFVICTLVAGRVAGVRGREARDLPGAFAHSLVPVAAGYVVAHYWSFLVLEGQNAFIRLSDPLGTGANWLGLSHRAPDVTLVQPRLVALIQVAAIVVGHVLGVILAHDRAVRLFAQRRALVGQLPLLAVMVAYTCGGLLLLFSG